MSSSVNASLWGRIPSATILTRHIQQDRPFLSSYPDIAQQDVLDLKERHPELLKPLEDKLRKKQEAEGKAKQGSAPEEKSTSWADMVQEDLALDEKDDKQKLEQQRQNTLRELQIARKANQLVAQHFIQIDSSDPWVRISLQNVNDYVKRRRPTHPRVEASDLKVLKQNYPQLMDTAARRLDAAYPITSRTPESNRQINKWMNRELARKIVVHTDMVRADYDLRLDDKEIGNYVKAGFDLNKPYLPAEGVRKELEADMHRKAKERGEADGPTVERLEFSQPMAHAINNRRLTVIKQLMGYGIDLNTPISTDSMPPLGMTRFYIKHGPQGFKREFEAIRKYLQSEVDKKHIQDAAAQSPEGLKKAQRAEKQKNRQAEKRNAAKRAKAEENARLFAQLMLRITPVSAEKRKVKAKEEAEKLRQSLFESAENYLETVLKPKRQSYFVTRRIHAQQYTAQRPTQPVKTTLRLRESVIPESSSAQPSDGAFQLVARKRQMPKWKKTTHKPPFSQPSDENSVKILEKQRGKKTTRVLMLPQSSYKGVRVQKRRAFNPTGNPVRGNFSKPEFQPNTQSPDQFPTLVNQATPSVKGNEATLSSNSAWADPQKTKKMIAKYDRSAPTTYYKPAKTSARVRMWNPISDKGQTNQYIPQRVYNGLDRQIVECLRDLTAEKYQTPRTLSGRYKRRIPGSQVLQASPRMVRDRIRFVMEQLDKRMIRAKALQKHKQVIPQSELRSVSDDDAWVDVIDTTSHTAQDTVKIKNAPMPESDSWEPTVTVAPKQRSKSLERPSRSKRSSSALQSGKTSENSSRSSSITPRGDSGIRASSASAVERRRMLNQTEAL